MTAAPAPASPAPGTLAQRPSPLLVAVDEDPAVRIAFTGRVLDGSESANLSLLVGDGDVDQARRAALSLVGADPTSAVFMEQVHGGRVARVDVHAAGRGVHDHGDTIPAVDALVTEAAELALAVLVADCVPVILVDPQHAVAAVHAGRGGVVEGVVSAAVAALGSSDTSRVVAVIGPAIGGCCYEVPAEMVKNVAAQWPAAAATTTWGSPSLDLPAAVEQQLVSAGVGRVLRVGGCTRCSDNTWFSHRAASEGHAPAGRQAGLVLRASEQSQPPQSPQTTSLQSS